MKHARSDYDRIQDPAGLIPQDEPVFLLRARDRLAPRTIRYWVAQGFKIGVDLAMLEAADEQSKAMERWQAQRGSKTPDMPSTQDRTPETAEASQRVPDAALGAIAGDYLNITGADIRNAVLEGREDDLAARIKRLAGHYMGEQ